MVGYRANYNVERVECGLLNFHCRCLSYPTTAIASTQAKQINAHLELAVVILVVEFCFAEFL